jgi:acyl carrier protein
LNLKGENLTTLDTIREILVELLDVDKAQITAETYLVRDLEVESIDFLELAVALNSRFGVDVHDDTIFLRNLRIYLAEAEEAGHEPLFCLQSRFAFLSPQRIKEVLTDLDDGPVLKVKDLVSYVQWQVGLERSV